MKKKSKQAGSLGGGISGSGPSVFMLSADQEIAGKVEVVMKEIYQQIGIEAITYVTTINKKGVEVVSG